MIDYKGKYYTVEDGMNMVYISIDDKNFTMGSNVYTYTKVIEDDEVLITITENNVVYKYANGILVNDEYTEEYYTKMTNEQCAVKVVLSKDMQATIVVTKNEVMDENLFNMFSSFGNLYNGDTLFTKETIITSDLELVIKVQDHTGEPYLGRYMIGESYSDGEITAGFVTFKNDVMVLSFDDEIPYSSQEENGIYKIMLENNYFLYNELTDEMSFYMFDGTTYVQMPCTRIPEDAKLIQIKHIDGYTITCYFVTSGNNLVFTPSDNGQCPYQLQEENGTVFNQNETEITKDMTLYYLSLNPFTPEQNWVFEETDRRTTYTFYDNQNGLLMIECNEENLYQPFSYVLTKNSINSNNFDISISYVFEENNVEINLTYIKETNTILDALNNEYIIQEESFKFEDCFGDYVVLNTSKYISISLESIDIEGEIVGIVDKQFMNDFWIIVTDKQDLKTGNFIQLTIYSDGSLDALNNIYVKQ